MPFGGQSAPQPQSYSPQQEAEAQWSLEQRRADEERRRAEEERIRQEQEQQRLRDEFNTNLGAARTGTTTTAQQIINERYASNPDVIAMLQDPLTRQIGQVANSIPDLAPNPQSLFDPQSIVNDIIAQQRTNKQNQSISQLDAFAPQGFALNMLPNTTDDDIINSIISEQYDLARQPVERALARGTLDDLGYNSALSDLFNQKSTAESRLQDVGGGFLETGRNDLRGIADEGRNYASTLDLTSLFNPTSYQSRIDSTLSGFNSGLEGRIRGGIGDVPLFSSPSAIARGGVAQGVRNPGAEGTDVAQILSQQKEDENKRRGIGTQGVF